MTHRIRIVALLLLVVAVGCTSEEERFQTHLQEATVASEAGDFAEAEIALRGALRLRPRDAGVNEELARVLEKQGEYGDAIFYYEEASRLDPDSVSAELALARLLFGDDRDRSRDLLADALERDPSNPRVYVARSSLALLDEDVDAALTAAVTATELGPEDARAWGALATVYQARVRQAKLDREKVDMSDFEQADAALQKAIALEGPYSRYAHERAKLISTWPGRSEEARDLLLAIIDSEETPAPLRVQVALSLFEYGYRRKDVGAMRLAVPIIVEANENRIDAWEAWARVEESAEPGAGEAVWKKLLAASPDQLRSYEYYAGYLAGTGRLDEAVAFLDDAARDFGDPAGLLARENSLLLEARDFDRAQAVRERLVREYPTSAYTRLAQARAVFSEGDTRAAADLLREVSTDLPTVEVFRYLAYAELANRNLPAAEQAIGRAMEARGQFEPGLVRTRAQIRYQARDWLRVIRSLRAIRNHGFRIRPNERVWLADANYALGKPDPARRVLEDLLSNDDAPLSAVVSYLDHELDNDPEKVAEVVANARARHPDNVTLIVMAAQVALARERTEEADALLAEAIDRDDPSVPALVMRGRLRLARGDAKGAGEDAERALAIEPTNGNATAIYSRALGRQDRLDDLQRSLEAEVAAGSISFVGKRTLAALYVSRSRYTEAIRFYEELLAEQPEDAWLQNDLAFLLARQGIDVDRALDLSRSAVAALPASAQATDTLGYVYITKGLTDAALRQFDAALDAIDPRNTELVARIHAHRGMALRQLGRQGDAEAAFAMARQVDPTIDVEADDPVSAGT